MVSPALADFDLYNGATDAGVFVTEPARFTFDDFADGAVADNTTPEPGSLALLSADTLAFMVHRRR